MGGGETGCQREECLDSVMPTHDLGELKGEIYFTVHDMKLCTKTQCDGGINAMVEGSKSKESHVLKILS